MSKKEELQQFRKTIVFNGGLEPDTVKALIDEIETYEKVDLYFCSNGGYASCTKILANCLNKHPDVVLYPYDHIASGGADLTFVYCECPVIITSILDYVTFHGQDRELYANRSSYYDSKAFRAIDVRANKKTVKKYEFMTDDQKSDYLNGKDILIYQTGFKVFRGFKDNVKIKL